MPNAGTVYGRWPAPLEDVRMVDHRGEARTRRLEYRRRRGDGRVALGPGVGAGPTTTNIRKGGSRSLHPTTAVRTAADVTRERVFVAFGRRGCSSAARGCHSAGADLPAVRGRSGRTSSRARVVVAVTGALTIHNRGRFVSPSQRVSRSASPNRRRWIGLPGFSLRAHPRRDHGAAVGRPNGCDQVASWSCADCRPSRMGAVPSRGCAGQHANRGRFAPVDPLVLHRV